MKKDLIRSLFIGVVITAFPYGNAVASDGIQTIKVDQFGYRPGAAKVAVLSSPQEGFNAPSDYQAPEILYILKFGDNEEMFSGAPESWNNGAVHQQSGDNIWWFDFSELTIPGNYYIIDSTNHIRSDVFTISEHVYNHVLKHAVRMFYYQRCGVSKVTPYAENGWTDDACHIHEGQDKTCKNINGSGPEYDLSGGWHDAGDYNKYTNFTFSVIHHLLSAYEDNPQVFQDNYNIPESGNGIPDLLDEVKFELDFLQKMMLEDGSTLMKVAVSEHQSASPPSEDKSSRYFAPASASATRGLCSVFAHAYLIFKDIDKLTDYAQTLLDKSLLAWNWVKDHPEYSYYDNQGFSSANPERSEYDQDAYLFTAAVYLYLATGEKEYKSYIEENYHKIHALEWGYWYGYEYTYERALLDYCFSANPDVTICEYIHNNFRNSMDGDEFMKAVESKKDAYKAYLKDNDYGWGSNSLKSRVGELFYDAFQYGVAETDDLSYPQAAEDYLHYIHGRNALGMVFLTNMNEYGASSSANEMYHLWFKDGTDFDNAQTSKYGPPPGYLTGGVNKNYSPDGSYSGPKMTPPLEQPVQKSYKDWNTSWPENSWEITEPAIYYQASYIMLLSKFASSEAVEIDIPQLVTSVDTRPGNSRKKPYPVPARSHIVIPITGETYPVDLQLIDVAGRSCSLSRNEYEVLTKEIRINAQNLREHTYFMKICYIDRVETHKLLIK